MRICIDPGHGGKDPGAIGSKSLEKNINLAVGKLVRDMLIKKGHKVVMARGNDSYVDLATRCKIANNFKAEIFLSIHCNSSAVKTAHGTETLYASDKGKLIAKRVQDSVLKVIKTRNRGLVYRDDLWVLNGTKMPAALIELAFISNPVEQNTLLVLQKEIAKAIADALWSPQRM